MKNRKLYSIAMAAMILSILFSCKGKEIKKEEKANEEVIPDTIVEIRDDQVKLAGIETGTLELRSLSGSLKVNGIVTTDPQSLATVCMPMGGFVKSITSVVGNNVSKGQTLAVLENQDFIDIQQNYLEAKNKLEFADAEYKRHSQLYQDDVYSKQNLQQVTADFKNLKAQVRALEQKLILIGINPSDLHEDNIRNSVPVVSPISGFIKSIRINIGKYVSPSDVMFEIVNDDKLFLELSLFEKDAALPEKGQLIHFTINNETDMHDAVIIQTGKAINQDKSCIVYASVTGKCRNLIPGMFVNAIIETSTNKVPSLPSEAIVTFENKDYIFALEREKTENGRLFNEYRMIEVHRGITDEGFTEVILPAGIDAGRVKIVVKGAYNLLSAKKNAGEMSC